MDADKNSVDQLSFINDIRTQANFKGISFSKYKKTEVKKTFIESMLKGKIEPACHWCCELICAGHFTEVWEIIMYYMGKHIHLGNPKLVIYIEKRYDVFKNIMNQGHFINEMQLRNNSIIRKLFAEIICILTMSNKKHSFEQIHINRMEEYDITQMAERLKAPNMLFVEPIFKKEDPKELIICINEFAYNISCEKPNIISACYWIEWIIEFDLICKKRKESCFCETRTNINVENKYRKDIIWLIWDTLLHYSKEKGSFVVKTMESLLNLFCIKYTTAACKKRKYLLYFAVGLLTEPIQTNNEIITDKIVLQTVIEQIDQIYKQVKKNEESPNTDYLFSMLNEKQNTFEKSVKKMEMLSSLDFVPRCDF